MDEKLSELVSRHVDGDLDETESTRLEERARADAVLSAEIESARELRSALATLAAGMEPPAVLDQVMDPLRRSVPAPKQRVRPLYRWLGAAAAVVLGVTVTVEMVRRNPEPTLTRSPSERHRQSRQQDEIFELAPLPTANPDEERPIGAADRLLEEEPPLPDAPEPSALEVMGPLSTQDSPAEIVQPPPGEEIEDPDEVSADGMAAPPRTESLAQRESAAGVAAAPPKLGQARSQPSREKAGRLDSASTEAAEGAGKGHVDGKRMVLEINGVEVLAIGAPGCSEAAWQAWVEVLDGRLTVVEPLRSREDRNTSAADLRCRPTALIGSSLVGVADGRHPAVITVALPPS